MRARTEDLNWFWIGALATDAGRETGGAEREPRTGPLAGRCSALQGEKTTCDGQAVRIRSFMTERDPRVKRTNETTGSLSACGTSLRVLEPQKGFATANSTMAIIRTVGTSFIQR